MRSFLILLAFVGWSSLAAQEAPVPQGWHLLDASADGYRGISLNKAYEFLKNKKSTTVIVAVIDSGLDTAQEDLKPILWTNTREIAGNGKDDDGNGYTDDIHGWNFCGSPDGQNLARNTHEVTRVYHNWKAQFEGKKEKEIPAAQKFLFSQWTKAAGIIEAEYKEATAALPDVANFVDAVTKASDLLTAELKVKSFTAADIKSLSQSRNPQVARAAAIWTNVFSRGSDPATLQTQVIDEVKAYQNDLQNKIDRKEKTPEDFRGQLVHDRYTDINDSIYGNNNLKAGSGDHGTLVSGVIGAVRHNNVGVDGIADNVRIMAVRAVPGGDEHDKDVALAIRYAVDNGASIINMSFGKPVSPYKQMVDDAVKYAASRGVLLVHGSGNDGKDITKDVFYPNPVFLDNKRATNYITVGASGNPTGPLAASFSNYSKEWVDIFAPGTAIYSTATDNRYLSADGTSLACPVVTGVAALLKSYYPSLTPEQIIHILTTSGRPVTETTVIPGTQDKKTSFANLSSSGRIVNAYEAVLMAEKEAGTAK